MFEDAERGGDGDDSKDARAGEEEVDAGKVEEKEGVEVEAGEEEREGEGDVTGPEPDTTDENALEAAEEAADTAE